MIHPFLFLSPEGLTVGRVTVKCESVPSARTYCKGFNMLRVALQTESNEAKTTQPQQICKLEISSCFDWCDSCVKHKLQFFKKTGGLCWYLRAFLITRFYQVYLFCPLRAFILMYQEPDVGVLLLVWSCYVSLWSFYHRLIHLQARPSLAGACMWPCVITSCPGTPWPTPRRRAWASAIRWAVNAR